MADEIFVSVTGEIAGGARVLETLDEAGARTSPMSVTAPGTR